MTKNPSKAKAYYLRNREKLLARKAEYHRENSVKLNLKSKAWYAANKDRAKSQQAEYRKKNKERDRNRFKEYRKNNRGICAKRDREKRIKNREAILKYLREYRKQNPHVFSRANAKRRSLELAQYHPYCNDSIVEQMFIYAKDMEKRTGVRQSLDHVIPLCHGGWHHHDNLQILPSKMNSEKSGNPFWIAPYGYRDWRNVPRYLWPKNLRNEYEKIIMDTKPNDY